MSVPIENFNLLSYYPTVLIIMYSYIAYSTYVASPHSFIFLNLCKQVSDSHITVTHLEKCLTSVP